MRFIKYNITKGKSAGSNSTVAVATVNNPTVDLSSVYARLNEDEATINELNRQVTLLNDVANGLESKYLRKDKSDATDYTLSMGNARSNSFVSNRYDSSGIGFLLAETGSASSNPNYALILSGLGNGSSQINSKSVQLDEQIMNYDTIYNQSVLLECSSCFTVNTTTDGAYVLIDAGYTCGSNYTILEESLYMTYFQEMHFNATPDQFVYYGVELERQGNYWKVPLVSDGRNTTYNLKYVVRYSYVAPSSDVAIGQALNLYIKGTNTTTTDFYGGVANKLVATPDYLQLTTNGAGIRITSQGIFRMDSQGNMTQLL